MTPDSRAEGFVAGARKIVQILRYGPRELAFALLGLLLLGAIPLLPKLAELLPFLTLALPWVTGVLVVLGLFLLGFAVWRIWKKAVAPLPEAKPKPAAIKGPAPFGPQDAELFARLGRNDDLNRLRDWILDDQKPLVALMGESGVGKTSLLRAGLAHHLQDDKVPVLYWEAVPTEPEAKLLHAIRVGWEDEEKAPKTFEELAAVVASSRRVVVIDQAEQLSPEKHPRIFEMLRHVAIGDPPYRSTWVVAFRREFLPVWRDFELSLPEAVQRRMETLSLKRFFPKAAEKVIAVLAEEGSVPVDQKVIEDLVKSISGDGRVSPADIGISLLVLSELVGGRPDASLSQDDFRESGGQAGLLTRYLERLFEQLPDSERRELLQALLSLIDLERDQRLAEGRTLEQMKESARPTVPVRFERALAHLASGKSRVLEELPGDFLSYRLVHERLILPIRRLTGVLLAEAEQAGLLLERSFRVWARNRQLRYLLIGRDLWQVLRFQDQIAWGADAADKRTYLRKSLAYRRHRLIAVLMVLLTLISFRWWSQIQLEEERQLEGQLSRLEGWGLPRDFYDHLPQIKELTLPGVVNQVDWLTRAKRLNYLRIEGGSVVSLEGLPKDLQTLDLGSFRDPMDSLPEFLKALSVRGPISFVQLPAGLRTINLGKVESMLALPDWPLGVISIELQGKQLDYLDLVEEPRTLRVLRLKELSIRGLKVPSSLESLHLVNINLSEPLRLPSGLKMLELVDSNYELLADVPPDLESAYLSCQSLYLVDRLVRPLRFLAVDASSKTIDEQCLARIETQHKIAALKIPAHHLSYLPPRLVSLTVIGPFTMSDIPRMWPLGLRHLEIKNWVGGSLDNLPEGLASLSIESEAGGALDDCNLPSGLVSLTLDNVNLRASTTERLKAELPQSLTTLALRRMSIPNLELPQGIRVLDLRGSRFLQSLRRIKSLRELDLSGGDIEFADLEWLPREVRSLRFGVNQVNSLRGLPRSVEGLHFTSEAVDRP
jgi:ABC-type dipeptide/oligopeptide/nickel transport system ATPase subunit